MDEIPGVRYDIHMREWSRYGDGRWEGVVAWARLFSELCMR
jgi:hypothetical protein